MDNRLSWFRIYMFVFDERLIINFFWVFFFICRIYNKVKINCFLFIVYVVCLG